MDASARLGLHSAASISSRQHPLVRTYRALARARDPGDRRILLEGLHLIQAAHRAGLTVVTAAVSTRLLASRGEAAATMRALETAGGRVVSVTESVMAAMSPARTASGFVAIAEYGPMTMDRVFDRDAPLVIVAVDVQDPGNLGALVRAADAGYASGVLVCGASADPFGWKALRGAMGSAFRLPVIPRLDVDAALAAARGRGLTILAASPHGGRAPDEIDLTGPVAFIVGGEGPGLDARLRALADLEVSWPMRPGVDSLNVAVASALLVYEAYRQRRGGKPGDSG